MQIDIIPGRVVLPNGSTGVALLTANAVHLCPLDIPVPISIDRIVLNVATAAAGATTGGVTPEVGLYVSDPSGKTFKNILRAPITAANLTSTGNKNVDLPGPFSIPKGRIWLAIYNPTYATTQPTLRAVVSNNHASLDVDTLADGAVLQSQSRQVRVGSVTAGLPDRLDNATFTFGDNLNVPILGLRVASVGIAPAVNPIPATPASNVTLPGAVQVPSGTQTALTPSLTDLPTALPTGLQ
jgi:hypothetical protein